jgi:hypothetical protein
MIQILLKRLVLLTAFCIASACGAFADSIVENFPTAGDAFTSAINGNGTIPSGGQTQYQWTTGDSVTSAVFTDIPSNSVTGLQENWTYQDVLGGGGSETWDILVNGLVVGSEKLTGCDYCSSDFTLTNTINFAGIAPLSGGYQVELLLANTVPGGEGSVAWLDGGETTLYYTPSSVVPEPSGLALLVLALMAAFGWARTRARA